MGRREYYDGARKFRNDRYSEPETKTDDVKEVSSTEEVSDTVEEAPVKEIQNEKPVADAPKFKKVAVSLDNLNIRKGPGKNYDRTGAFTGKGIFEIVETTKGDGSNKGWGKLSTGEGWISLDFCEELK